MLPTRERTEELLIEAEKCNPGAWGIIVVLLLTAQKKLRRSAVI